MTTLAQLQRRIQAAALAVPAPPAERGYTSEEMIRKVAQIVAEDDEHEAAVALLPTDEQSRFRAEERLGFLRGLEEGSAEERDEWERMHAQAVRVLADPAHSRMIPVLRRFVEGIARLSPATPAEKEQLAREAARS